MRTVILVPARGQSKGIPRKNLRSIGGRPLLAYTAETALAVTRATTAVLTTEDPEIAELGRRLGLRVPFMRPAELARDDTPTLPVVQHALRRLEEFGERYDAVCLLQPTCPLRPTADVNGCIELLETSGADAVVTVLPVPWRHNPHWVYFRDEGGSLRISTGATEPVPRRQSLPPAFHRAGSVYVTRRDVILTDNSLYGRDLRGYVIDPEGFVDLDTAEDWVRAETLINARVGAN
jgi:CMP-N,N'-diacetyllegionaminic acid synthase